MNGKVLLKPKKENLLEIPFAVQNSASHSTTNAMDDSISIISSEYVFDSYNDQRLLKYVDQVIKNSSC